MWKASSVGGMLSSARVVVQYKISEFYNLVVKIFMLDNLDKNHRYFKEETFWNADDLQDVFVLQDNVRN
jgi:hypothetical protein